MSAALGAGVACSGENPGVVPGAASTPERGGTVLVIGNADVDHLSTSAGYYTPTNQLMHTFTRQLVSYPADSGFEAQTVIVPDLATAIPTRENGGASADGRTWTFHLRPGVLWNSRPPRAVTAKDVVRGFKMLCNPVAPVGAPGYFNETLLGMDTYCDAFAKVDGTVEGIKAFLASHALPGVRAVDDSTVVFRLVAPASDFLHILAMDFSSPMPVEYLDYAPDGPEFRDHTISLGPYQITHYIPNREIDLGRNPVWDSTSDPLRKAYVDSIQVIEGLDQQSVQQQLQAGTADVSWDQTPPTADLATLLATHDPNLILGPPGDHYSTITYLSVNLLSPNAGGALKKLAVRQALEYLTDRAAIAQNQGGPAIARSLTQAVVSGVSGHRDGFDPYPSPGNHGDVARAKSLLAQAGVSDGLTLKLLYRTYGNGPKDAETLQAAFARAGVTLALVPSTGSDFLAKYVQNPENARRGVWDLALGTWVPDWFGNSGRTVIEALFDGRTYGPASSDWGDYNSDSTNRLIDQALAAPSEAEADRLWQQAATRVIEDAAIIPLTESKYPVYYSSRVRNCIFSLTAFNCDLTVLWLEGAGAPRP